MKNKFIIAIFFVSNTLFLIALGFNSEVSQNSLDSFELLSVLLIINFAIGLILITSLLLYRYKSFLLNLKDLDYEIFFKKIKRPENLIKSSLIIGIFFILLSSSFYLNEEIISQNRLKDSSKCFDVDLTYYTGKSCLNFKSPNKWYLEVNMEEKFPQTIVDIFFINIIKLEYTNGSSNQPIPLDSPTWVINESDFTLSLEILTTDSSFPNSYDVNAKIRFDANFIDGNSEIIDLDLKNSLQNNSTFFLNLLYFLLLLIVLVLTSIIFYALYLTFNPDIEFLSLLTSVKDRFFEILLFLKDKFNKAISSLKSPILTSKGFVKPKVSSRKSLREYSPGLYYQLSKELIPIQKKKKEYESEIAFLDSEINYIEHNIIPYMKNRKKIEHFNQIKKNFEGLLNLIIEGPNKSTIPIEMKLVEKIRTLHTNQINLFFYELTNYRIMTTYSFFLSQGQSIWKNKMGFNFLINDVDWNTNQELELNSILDLFSFIKEQITAYFIEEKIEQFYHIEANFKILLNFIIEIHIKSIKNKEIRKLVKKIHKRYANQKKLFFSQLYNYKLLITYSFFVLHGQNTWKNKYGYDLLITDFEWNLHQEMEITYIIDLFSFIEEQINFLDSIQRKNSKIITAEEFLNNINEGETKLSSLNQNKRKLRENYDKILKEKDIVEGQIRYIIRKLDTTNSKTGNKFRLDYIKMGKQHISVLKKLPSKNKEKIEQIVFEIQYFETQNQG